LARDATDADIAKLGTPIVRANELDERFAASRRIGSVGEISDEEDSGIPGFPDSLIADLNSLRKRRVIACAPNGAAPLASSSTVEAHRAGS
jgi:hypothetical protein